jgi:protein-tyrosine phosphatase
VVAFGVLFVCTGNVCRSPMAEFLLRAESAGALVTASAGMHALVGEPMDPPSALVLAEQGIDASAHRARQFEVSMAKADDLILTAERAHRDHILTDTPTLYRRVFTMKEYVRLAEPIGGATPAEVVAAAAARRGLAEVVPESADDITDPFRGTVAQARAVAEQLRVVIRTVVATLTASTSGSPRHIVT